MILHILRFCELICFSFSFLSPSLCFRWMLCNFAENLFVMSSLISIHPATQMILDNPVNLKIRISSDRWSKMTIIIKCKSEVSCTLGAVLSLHHWTQSHLADYCFFLTAFYILEELLELFWLNSYILPGSDMVSEIADKSLQSCNLLRIRLFVNSVHEGWFHKEKMLSHSLVCCQHEVLN